VNEEHPEEGDKNFKLSDDDKHIVDELRAAFKARNAIPQGERVFYSHPRFSENFGPIQGEDGEWYFPKSPDLSNETPTDTSD
jgi:hypothetical protein